MTKAAESHEVAILGGGLAGLATSISQEAATS